jgi:predicted RNase H-like HicB family nuclease
MRSYYAIVHKDEDSAFGVSFPDLPSVFSAADTEDEIIANAVEALRLWAEDMELPSPSTLEIIRARPDVREALAEGAFVVRVPLIEDDTRVVRANVSFEAGMLRAIDETARKRGLTRAAFLASAARKEIEGASRN